MKRTIVGLLALAVLLGGVANQGVVFAQCVAPPAGVVSWWPGNGNTDDIIGGNPGSLFAGATYATGYIGEAFSLDGVDDFVEIHDAANLDLLDSLTVEAWIYQTAAQEPGETIVGHWGLSDSFLFRMEDNGQRLEMRVDEDGEEGGSINVFSTTEIPINTWTHVAGVVDGQNDEISVFINGVRDNSAPFVGPLFNSTSPIQIGMTNPPPGWGWFPGLIDEAAIYDRVLSDAEIQAIYNAGSAGKCTGPTPTPTPTATPTPTPTPTPEPTPAPRGPNGFRDDFNDVAHSLGTWTIVTADGFSVNIGGGQAVFDADDVSDPADGSFADWNFDNQWDKSYLVSQVFCPRELFGFPTEVEFGVSSYRSTAWYIGFTPVGTDAFIDPQMKFGGSVHYFWLGADNPFHTFWGGPTWTNPGPGSTVGSSATADAGSSAAADGDPDIGRFRITLDPTAGNGPLWERHNGTDWETWVDKRGMTDGTNPFSAAIDFQVLINYDGGNDAMSLDYVQLKCGDNIPVEMSSFVVE